MISNDKYPHVFSPIQIGPVTFRNRLGFSPMVCNQCDIDGTVTDSMTDFVGRQAATGVGYVTIGDTQVDDKKGGAFMATLNVERETSIPGLTRLADAARYAGAVLSVELNHSGRGAKDDLIEGEAYAPSAIPFEGCSQNVKEMTHEEMEETKAKFVACARRCVFAGFPMVMLHCAHNNLLGQFLSPLSNHRTDEYGGSPENRRRYPLEVIKAVREEIGSKAALEIRVSAEEVTEGSLTFEESLAFMKEAQAYVDLIHISRGIIYNKEWKYTLPTFLRDRRLNLEWARAAKKELDVPVATVGNFSTLQEAEDAIADGACDIVNMARSYLADPELIQKSVRGQEDMVRPCLRCHRGCIDNSSRGKAIHCTVNPALGFEPEMRGIGESKEAKKVLVIGGGPAGMVAAQTLISRGHSVTLVEQSDHLGGLLVDAAAPSCKGYMKAYLEYLIHATSVCGARILLKTKADLALVEEENPDYVFVATGSEYLTPPIPGIDGKNIVPVKEADQDPDKLGKRVLICGGGSAGLECGLSLQRDGHEVTVADQLPLRKFAKGMPLIPKEDLRDSFTEAGGVLMPEHRIVSFDQDGASLKNADGEDVRIEADSIVIALGVKRRQELYRQLCEVYTQCIVPIGDCSGGTNLYEATHTAFFAALRI